MPGRNIRRCGLRQEIILTRWEKIVITNQEELLIATRKLILREGNAMAKGTGHVKPHIPYSVVSANGAVTHVMLPIGAYWEMSRKSIIDIDATPEDVVEKVLDGVSPMRAWREHKRLTQEEMARRMDIPRSLYAMMEKSDNPDIVALQRATAALGVELAQLAELYEDFFVSSESSR